MKYLRVYLNEKPSPVGSRIHVSNEFDIEILHTGLVLAEIMPSMKLKILTLKRLIEYQLIQLQREI